MIMNRLLNPKTIFENKNILYHGNTSKTFQNFKIKKNSLKY